MITLTVQCHDDAERLVVEQTVAFVRQLRQIAADAPHGAVLPACERAALGGGRALLRDALAAAGPRRGRRAKRGAARTCPCAHPGRHKGRHERTVLTAVGRLAVGRAYFACAACGQGDFGADRVLGVDGYLTVGARRMACLAGLRDSFARAQKLLTELAGWELDDETVRRLCHQEAGRATAEAFAAAPGDWELQIDAGKVNTQEGWRDVKAAVYARRERGEPARPAGWDQRGPPAAVQWRGLIGRSFAARLLRVFLALDKSVVLIDGKQGRFPRLHFPVRPGHR